MNNGQLSDQGAQSHGGIASSGSHDSQPMKRQSSASSAIYNGGNLSDRSEATNGRDAYQNGMAHAGNSGQGHNPYQDPRQPANPYMNPYGSTAGPSLHRAPQLFEARQHQGPSQSQGHPSQAYAYPPQGQFYPPTFSAPQVPHQHQQHHHHHHHQQLQQQHHQQQQQQQQQHGHPQYQRPCHMPYAQQQPPQQYQPQMQYRPYPPPQHERIPVSQHYAHPDVIAQRNGRPPQGPESSLHNSVDRPFQNAEHHPNESRRRSSATSPDRKRLKTDPAADGKSAGEAVSKADGPTLDNVLKREVNALPKHVEPERPTSPGFPVILPYDVNTLTWNAEGTLNAQHQYCYCGEDRNLLDVDVQCMLCYNFFHGKCIRVHMGYVVPFMTNYQFTCTNCSPDNHETFTRSACSWKHICGSVVANLALMRLRIDNPSWDKSAFAAKNNKEIMDQHDGWYGRKQDIVPFLRVPRHWAALCTDKEVGDSATWTSTLANALVSNPDLFMTNDESTRSANSFYTFRRLSLFSFRAGYLSGYKTGTSRKRKADGPEESSTPVKSIGQIPPERASGRDKSSAKSEDAPSFSQKIPTVKKEPPRALTTVAKELVRERKPTPKKAAVTKKVEAVPAKLIRRPPPYKPEDFGAVTKGPGLTQVEGHFQDGPYFSIQDVPFNKRGFKYTLCEAAPEMPAIMYRQTEVSPHTAHLDWSDMSPYLYLSKDAQSATTDKGFRMGRANVGVREGQWFWEVKVLRGNGEQGGHVRVGVARREASLDGPIGFDGYSYGIRDKGGEKMHLSRPKPFMESFGTGDVIGFHLTLPKAPTKTEISRDRIPIRYRQQLYFEQFDYTTSKEMEDLLHPGSAPSKSTHPPTLKGSSLKIYKNGKLMGTAFTDLYSFWPPNSQTTRDQPAGDDGALGYYPAISVYHGGAVRLNFGPDFEYAPKKVQDGSVRKMCQRYEEQVAEDILNDLIDEVDFARDLEELSRGQQELEVAPIREIAEYD